MKTISGRTVARFSFLWVLFVLLTYALAIEFSIYQASSPGWQIAGLWIDGRRLILQAIVPPIALVVLWLIFRRRSGDRNQLHHTEGT